MLVPIAYFLLDFCAIHAISTTWSVKSKETREMIEHNSEVYNHPYISFFIVHVYSYMEEDFCRGTYLFSLYMCIAIWKKISVGGVVYFTVSIIPLVSLLLAVLVSLHPATFFIHCIT